MRPLRLRLKGLRSYRQEAVVELADVGLMAVVGDTGAGKSSLLEALSYALYNCTTWDRKEVRALLGDDAQAVEVALEFAARGERWRVTRSFSAGTRPSTHLLECLSDPSVPKLDAEAAVTAECARLVGLGHESFLRSVVLPQGRFHELLHLTEARRTPILQGLFGLEELGEVRRQAAAMREEALDLLEPLDRERLALPEDPEAELRAAAAAERRAAAALAELDGWVEAHRAAGVTAAAEAAAAEAAARAAAELSGDHSPDVERLAAARDAECALGDEAAADAMLRARLAGDLAERDRRLAAATAAGLGPGQVGGVRVVLERLAADLPVLAAERERHAGAQAVWSAERETHAAAAGGLEPLADQARAAAKAAAAAENGLAEAGALVQRVVRALERVREGQAALAEVRERARRAGEGLAAAGARLADADAAMAAARAAADEASSRRRDAERRDAALHAAEGHGPGDPCPVCRRTLPAGFAAPEAPDLDAAREAERAAEGVRAEAEAAHARAAERLVGAGRESVSATAAHAAAGGEAERRLGELRALLPAADPAQGDDAVLGPVRMAHTDLVVVVEARRAERAAADAAHAERAAAHRAAGGRLEERGDQLRREAERIERLSADLERLSVGLPDVVRPASDGLAGALARFAEREREVGELTAERSALAAELSRLDRAEVMRAARRRDEVDAPREGARRRLDGLRAACRRAAEALGRSGPEPAGEAPVAGAEVVAAERLLALASELAEALAKRRDAALRAVAEADARAAATLRDARMSDAAALAAARDLVAAEALSARRALDAAEAAVPAAAALDADIVPAREMVDDLRALERSLTDGAFPRYAIGLRQAALLAVATEILGDMTGDRFGFSDRFEIVDVPAGRRRSPRTLSGGETFLASLALSLALVELTSRAGGLVECLFLDEGFGALDPGALDQALSELERRAAGGRLVGVISHVPAVAERIESVLHVTNDPASGSHVRMLDGAERERLLEGAAAGLIAEAAAA